MTIEILQNLNNEDVVIITNEDGSQISMLKSTYDEQQAALSTLASELVDPAPSEKSKK